MIQYRLTVPSIFAIYKPISISERTIPISVLMTMLIASAEPTLASTNEKNVYTAHTAQLMRIERKERRNPKANIGKPKPVSLKAMIWAVAVVPMFAPNITPTVFSKLIVPELAKLTTITVVAELDWISAVNNDPRATPNMGFDVILSRNFLNPVNAKISRFLLVRVIP